MQTIDNMIVKLVGNQIDHLFKAPLKVNGQEITTLEDFHKALNAMKVLCFQQNDSEPAIMIPQRSILDIVITLK